MKKLCITLLLLSSVNFVFAEQDTNQLVSNFLLANSTSAVKLDSSLSKYSTKVRQNAEIGDKLQFLKERSVSVTAVFLQDIGNKAVLKSNLSEINKLELDLKRYDSLSNTNLRRLNSQVIKENQTINPKLSENLTSILKVLDSDRVNMLSSKDIALRIQFLEIYKQALQKLLTSKSKMSSINGDVFFENPDDEYIYWKSVVDGREKYKEIISNETELIGVILNDNTYKQILSTTTLNLINQTGLEKDMIQKDYWSGNKVFSRADPNIIPQDKLQSFYNNRDTDSVNKSSSDLFTASLVKFGSLIREPDTDYFNKEKLSQSRTILQDAVNAFRNGAKREYQMNTVFFKQYNQLPNDVTGNYFYLSDEKFDEENKSRLAYFRNLEGTELLLYKIDLLIKSFGKYKVNSDSNSTSEFIFTNPKVQMEFDNKFKLFNLKYSQISDSN